MNYSSTLVMQDFQRNFLESAALKLKRDTRLSGLLLAGSALQNKLDEFSDLDFIVICRDDTLTDVLEEKRSIADSLGKLVAAFTGEHVGEPHLLICLYADPLLHVDLKFVDASALDQRVETPMIVWADEPTVERLERGRAQWPSRDAEWFEERFWIWIHYGLTKIGRGELFEAIAMLNFLREQVIGPLLARSRAFDQRGVRRVEKFYPDHVASLASTLSLHERSGVLKSYEKMIEIYCDLRDKVSPANQKLDGEKLVREFLRSLT